MNHSPPDHIVIGGGSAGCVVAGELARRGHRVLLLERGPGADEAPETLRADGYKDAFINDRIFFERFSEPQAHCGGQRFFLGTGSVLGGSGAVNGMVYTRGDRRDYDEWPQGWRWDEVTPDFEALERQLRIHQRPPTQWTAACIEAAETCGFRHRHDFNDGALSNAIGYEWMSYEGAQRRSSYVAFIRDAEQAGELGDRLQVHTGALVERVVIEGGRAAGVTYQHQGRRKTVHTAGEVVLCAGALETPKLLMLSGIGPAAELGRHGIEVVADVPAIGDNLHDHPNVPLFFRSRGQVDCHYPQLYSFFRTLGEAPLPAGQSDTCYVFWPAPSAMKEATQRMLPAQLLPERLYHSPAKQLIRGGIEAAFQSGFVRRQVDHLFAIVVILGKPQSRGRLGLRSRDAAAHARVDPHYFEHPQDMETMVRGVRLARDLADSSGLRDYHARELMPGVWVQSDAAIARWIRNNAITTYHFAGTCRMGDSEDAPVDPQLRLRAVAGLRIADASAIPVTPVSALNAPSMLIGLRAARLIADVPS